MGLAQVDVIQGSHQSKDIDTYAWEYIIKLKLALTHSWQRSYKCLDSLWFSLMALGLHYYVKQGFKQKIFDPTIDNGLKLAFIDATY